MGFARFLLILNGLSFLGYGLYCWINPAIVGQFSGLEFASSAAVTEIHAMYGGLQTGTGLFFLTAGFKRPWAELGLLAMVLIMGGLALARGYGMAIHSVTSYNEGAITYEALSAVLALIAMFRLSVASGDRRF